MPPAVLNSCREAEDAEAGPRKQIPMLSYRNNSRRPTGPVLFDHLD